MSPTPPNDPNVINERSTTSSASTTVNSLPTPCMLCGSKLSKQPNKQTETPGPKIQKVDNGFYLSIILGSSINLTMTSADRFNFKKDYEKFKVRVTMVNFLLLLLAYLFPSRPLDLVCHFLMVWYYCTLTIRESILRINGSQMHWWWVAHHYLATVIGGVAVTWPDDNYYQTFRSQFLFFALYISVVQKMQFQYQNGCLRRLHALGKGDQMDLTLEGFASWMFQGLSFLIPFLIIAYIFELHISYTLYSMFVSGDTTWHVPVLSILFFLVGNGNILMVFGIILHKTTEDPTMRKQSLKTKYSTLQE